MANPICQEAARVAFRCVKRRLGFVVALAGSVPQEGRYTVIRKVRGMKVEYRGATPEAAWKRYEEALPKMMAGHTFTAQDFRP